MTYAVLADLVTRAGIEEIRAIADRNGDGEPDGLVVAAALVQADQLINGYVGTRYSLVMTEVPAIMVGWATSIARYLLHAQGAPDHVAQDYKEALAALKDVAKGLISLPLSSGATVGSGDSGTVLAAHPDTVFTTDRLRGW
jgi:phage gp36-like protein